MPLEAIMIAVDNSDYMRNGDYTPTRFLAQNEAVSYLANAKLQENQESSVGLMSVAGARIQVLCSPGREPGQLLNSLAKDVRIGGRSNFLSALKTAQLALKNRQNKNQRQRVIMFVGSPIETSADELVKLGKVFKKNNVAIDVINFGTENTTNDNTEKLEQLIAAVNTSDNSHLVSIPPGPHIFADLVLTSAIMQSGGGGGGGPISAVGGPSAVNHPGGIDPSMDPEMAMAIRMSMEEERQRQQKASGDSGAPAATSGGAAAATAGGSVPMEEDEEALLAQAIAMSMQENTDMTDVSDASTAAATSTTAAASSTTATPATAAEPTASEIDIAMNDPDFLNSLLTAVPGAEGDQLNNLLDELTGAKPPAPKDEKKEGDKK